MTHSLLGADRITHLKILTVALVACVVFVMVGIAAHLGDFETAGAMMQNQPVVKAGKSTIFTTRYDVTSREGPLHDCKLSAGPRLGPGRAGLRRPAFRSRQIPAAKKGPLSAEKMRQRRGEPLFPPRNKTRHSAEISLCHCHTR